MLIVLKKDSLFLSSHQVITSEAILPIEPRIGKKTKTSSKSPMTMFFKNSTGNTRPIKIIITMIFVPISDSNFTICSFALFVLGSHRKIKVAEEGGFEPPVPVAQHDNLANCWFQPLTHSSTKIARCSKSASTVFSLKQTCQYIKSLSVYKSAYF